MADESLDKLNVGIRTENTDIRIFFEAVWQAFQRAEEAVGGSIDRFFRIGDFTLRLRFAGPALVPHLTPALEHLSSESCSIPALTICLWDSVSTQTKLPPFPRAMDEVFSRRETLGYIIMNDPRTRLVQDLGTGALNLLDASLNLAFYWTHDAGRVPDVERGAPLRTIFHWWMREQGHRLAHAAAVGRPEGGILLVGKGGSGKSTVVLACLTSELLFIGDDYVLLRREPSPFVCSLYNSAKLDARHLQNFPYLLPAVTNSQRLGTEKALLFLHSRFSERISRGFPVQAIFLPRITQIPETKLSGTSAASIFAELAPSTIFQLVGADQSDFRDMGRFVKQVPCYVLEVGTDLCRIPNVILSFLSEKRACKIDSSA